MIVQAMASTIQMIRFDHRVFGALRAEDRLIKHNVLNRMDDAQFLGVSDFVKSRGGTPRYDFETRQCDMRHERFLISCVSTGRQNIFDFSLQ